MYGLRRWTRLKLFSQRKGFTPVRTLLQKDGMDAALRNRLWNAFLALFRKLNESAVYTDVPSDALQFFTKAVWDDFYRSPLDTIPSHPRDIYADFRKRFFEWEWSRVYDFLEFCAQLLSQHFSQEFVNTCNMVLEAEMSAYRFVGSQIVELTSTEEIESIEGALAVSGPLKSVSAHLGRALELLADRKTPDYRNSIKESISAVEAVCKVLANKPKAVLTEAITALEKKAILHHSLKSAFVSLYHYTSDAQGIRHALMDEATLNQDDAKFMLVACSAFVNYVVALAAKNGLTL